jgi:uncharacterized membrane protein (DUF2068 family)
MASSSSRSLSLITKLLVIKKMLSGGLMLVISAICFLGWRYYDSVMQFAEQYLLTMEHRLVNWVVTHIANTPPHALIKVAELTGVYGLLIEITAICLWLGMAWAEPLFIGLVAAPIPLEVKEILHHPTPLKIAFCALNLFVVIFLTRRWLKALGYFRKATAELKVTVPIAKQTPVSSAPADPYDPARGR